MRTTEVIDRLACELTPVAPSSVLRRLALGLGAGALASTALLLATLGLRSDLVAAVSTQAYWIKFLYTLALAGCGLAAVERLSRPGGRVALHWALIGGVFAVIAVLALVQLAWSAPAMQRHLIMGASAKECASLVALLSLPILAGAIWAMRSLAPTNLPLAGWGAGLAAGSLGAWIYAFHCNETAVPFLAIWYTSGILAAGAVGAILGRYLLRW